MRCVVSELAVSASHPGGTPRLLNEGQPLLLVVNTKLLPALERQGVSPRREMLPALSKGVGTQGDADADAEMSERSDALHVPDASAAAAAAAAASAAAAAASASAGAGAFPELIDQTQVGPSVYLCGYVCV